MELFVSECHDIYENLALEESLFRKGVKAVFIWTNDPCVVIGRSQNPFLETNTRYLDEHGIMLARRLSGGGAVFHDRGNLNYSVMSGTPCEDETVCIVLEVLEQLGAPACRSGRNDILVNDRKIGGLAQYHNDWFLCHGTLMVNVDLDMLTEALRPSPLKLSKHGIQSVRSRVGNLANTLNNCSIQQIIETFASVVSAPPRSVSPSSETLIRADELKSREWLYGASPAYEATQEILFDGELYTFVFNVRKGIMTSVSISTDSLTFPELSKACASLEGKAFDPETFNDLARHCLQAAL